MTPQFFVAGAIIVAIILAMSYAVTVIRAGGSDLIGSLPVVVLAAIAIGLVAGIYVGVRK